METVRIWFKKKGSAKYISHLDLMRCMGNALKIGKLPVWYTEGFNPKIYMNFAMPLSLGTSGDNEMMDFRIIGDATDTEIVNAISKGLPSDIRVFKAGIPQRGFDEIKFAVYELFFESEDAGGIRDTIYTILAKDKIEVVKKGKKGDKVINIKAYFQDVLLEMRGNTLKAEILLPCSQEGSINPNLFIKALKDSVNQDFYVRINRRYLLCGKKDILV